MSITSRTVFNQIFKRYTRSVKTHYPKQSGLNITFRLEHFNFIFVYTFFLLLPPNLLGLILATDKKKSDDRILPFIRDEIEDGSLAILLLPFESFFRFW